MALEKPKEIRDRHSEYKRVYFAEEIKQRIAFFLSDKLFGKNLDIGGGRYSYYPDSTVIDLSPVALQHNPSKHKVEFDMESIETGNKLPFPDNSFDHATMVSVFQYIQHQKEVVQELMRVLKPGAEIFIMNCNGGLSECMHNTTNAHSIQNFFKEQGFTTIIENIPFRENIKEFQSVGVTMPDIDLFGETQGKVRNQKERINQDKIYSHYKPFFLTLHNNYDDRNDDTRGNDVFTKEYLDRELRKINGLFAKISHYPITTYSKKYKENIEAFTEECLKETDAIPIMISNTYNDIRIDMLTSDDQIYPTLYLLGKKQEASGESKNKVMEIAKRFGLNPSSHMNYLPGYTTEKIIEFYKKRKTQTTHKWGEEQEAKLSDSEKEKLISFLTEIPLNSVTKTLQEKLYPIAKDWYPDIDMLIYLRKTRNYFGLLSAHKQIRSAELLLEKKRLCLEGKIETAGRKEIDYIPITKGFPKLLEQNDADAFRGHNAPPDY